MWVLRTLILQMKRRDETMSIDVVTLTLAKAYADDVAATGGNPEVVEEIRQNMITKSEIANDDDILDMLVSIGEVIPITDSNGAIYTDSQNRIFLL